VDLNKLHRIYFLGIGGIGMSALARYFHRQGVLVSGYDKTPTQLTTDLIEEGIAVHFDDDPKKIIELPSLVVYTPAVPKDLNEFKYVQKKGYDVKKRSEVLGELTRDRKTIAVAGTHGKTTISSMIAHILFQSKVGCNAFLGGITKNYNSNLLLSSGADYMVVEADEFDKSFLQLHPDISVVTSMDADHLDIYGDFNSLQDNFRGFVSQTHAGGTFICKKSVDLQAGIDVKVITYALKDKADFYAENISVIESQYEFDLVTNLDQSIHIQLGIPGLMNVENAVAASAAALTAGVSANELKKALASFIGIKRRFELIFNKKEVIYIDDYAHHPEEIKGLIKSVRHMYPDKKVLGIFQPHLYSRTRDFAEGFAESLDQLDEAILLPIYPAREKPIDGVESELILGRMKLEKKSIVQKSGLIENLQNKDFEILLTVGAGDIDTMVDPIEKFLKARKSKDKAQ